MPKTQAVVMFTQMENMQLRVTHRFIALITSGLPERNFYLTAEINVPPCALNVMYNLFFITFGTLYEKRHIPKDGQLFL